MEYDVALSFAGEDRNYVQQVAEHLVELDVRVFYDEYEIVTLWGKDLYTHLRDIYQHKAQFTIMFISEHYAAKLWTSHERESAQARAFSERREYILPVRFDSTEVPGLLPTIHYIDAKETSPFDLAKLIKRKIEISAVKPGGTAYSKLSNPELAVIALTFVGRLREALYEQELVDLEIHNKRYLELSTIDEDQMKTQKSRGYIDLGQQVRAQFVHRYSSDYKAEAILLRNEMVSRLPADLNLSQPSYIDHTYEYVSSFYDLRQIADDLDKLARSLP